MSLEQSRLRSTKRFWTKAVRGGYYKYQIVVGNVIKNQGPDNHGTRNTSAWSSLLRRHKCEISSSLKTHATIKETFLKALTRCTTNLARSAICSATCFASMARANSSEKARCVYMIPVWCRIRRDIRKHKRGNNQNSRRKKKPKSTEHLRVDSTEFVPHFHCFFKHKLIFQGSRIIGQGINPRN